jgi:cytochrome P450
MFAVVALGYAVAAYTLYLLIRFLYDLKRGYSFAIGIQSPLRYGPFENAFDLFRDRHRNLDMIVETHQLFGCRPWTLKIPLQSRWVMIGEPEQVECVLKTKFWSFEKGPELHGKMADLLGVGIFNVDGDRWQVQRKITSQIFHVKNFRDFFTAVFREETLLVLEILRRHADQGTVIDICDLLHRFTLESFARIGFGIELNILKNYLAGDTAPVPFAAAFDKAQNFTQRRIAEPFFSIVSLFDGRAKQLADAVKVIDDFAYETIRQRREDPDGANKIDLLSRFMNVKSDGPGYTDKELRDIVLNLIIAGRDTTAQALSWTLSELFQKPQFFDAIREEVATKIPGYSPYTADCPTYEQILTLTETKAIFTEALRLHPSVPVQIKIATEDVDLPGDVHIPKGVSVVYSSYLMGRLRSIWGDDVLESNPSRFIHDQTPNQFKYPVFNAGPRICLGMNMAYIEAVTVLSAIVSQFDLKLAMPQKDVVYERGLTLMLKNGLKVHVSKRM